MPINKYKEFIINYFENNASSIRALFPDISPDEYIKYILDEDQWVVDYKCKAGGGDYEFEDYTIRLPNSTVNRWGDPIPDVTRSSSDFVTETVMSCEYYEGGVAYVVLEDKAGCLHLADYVGD